MTIYYWPKTNELLTSNMMSDYFPPLPEESISWSELIEWQENQEAVFVNENNLLRVTLNLKSLDGSSLYYWPERNELVSSHKLWALHLPNIDTDPNSTNDLVAWYIANEKIFVKQNGLVEITFIDPAIENDEV